ncbi:MAG TPA: hypothetical protein VFG56_01365 [Candidatus Saccharimonadales bacterium]|nr:hypothetical protein [Candidatus Saccharimonadales bacterium]
MQPEQQNLNSPQTTNQPESSASTAPKTGRSLPHWLNRTGMYGFEQFMALVGLLTTAWVLDYGWFALFNTFSGSAFGSFASQMALFIVVGMLVWLPVTMFFFLRMRGQSVAQPEVNHSHLAKFFNAAYLVIAIMAAIGFAFTAIYSLLNSVVNLDQAVGETALRVTVPAVLSLLTELILVAAIMRPKGLFSRGKFAVWFSLLSLGVVVTLFILSAGNIRSYAADERVVNDFQEIHSSIQNYYDDNNRLPNRLDGSLTELSQEVSNRLGDYQYVPKTAGKYQLCADFHKASRGYDSVQPDDSYRTYVRSSHPDGHYCYNLKVYGVYSSDSFDLYRPSKSLY